MKIYNLCDKNEFLDEVILLEYNEWADDPDKDREERLKLKKEKISKLLEYNSYCKLILVYNDILIGFISLMPSDGEEEKDLTPWYGTMYVKKEYRKKGYSKILNDAILKEAKDRGFNIIYLKTDLNNYYEKFGAKYIKKLNNGEKLYKFDLR